MTSHLYSRLAAYDLRRDGAIQADGSLHDLSNDSGLAAGNKHRSPFQTSRSPSAIIMLFRMFDTLIAHAALDDLFIRGDSVAH